jgi:hypothetical protein
MAALAVVTHFILTIPISTPHFPVTVMTSQRTPSCRVFTISTEKFSYQAMKIDEPC